MMKKFYLPVMTEELINKFLNKGYSDTSLDILGIWSSILDTPVYVSKDSLDRVINGLSNFYVTNECEYNKIMLKWF